MRAPRGRWRARSAPQGLTSTRAAGSTLLVLGTVSQVTPSRSPTFVRGWCAFVPGKSIAAGTSVRRGFPRPNGRYRAAQLGKDSFLKLCIGVSRVIVEFDMRCLKGYDRCL